MSGVTTYRIHKGDDITDALGTTADADATAARISALYSGVAETTPEPTEAPIEPEARES